MSVAGLPRTTSSESRVGLLQLLLKSGADASKADDDGYTALHWAAAIGAQKRLASVVVVACACGPCAGDEHRSASFFIFDWRGYWQA
jgi:hypothetical protein